LLPGRWRSEAERLRELGAESQAKALEWCAGELEQAHREWELEALTLSDAADECGYSYSTLQKKVADGDVENMGEKNHPRIRRCDLPKKPSRPKPVGTEPDLAGEVLRAKDGH